MTAPKQPDPKVEEPTMKEKIAAVEAKAGRPILPEFKVIPFAKAQQVTLAQLKKATQVAIPYANVAVRTLNAQHTEALKIAYQNGEKIPPLELLNTTHGIVIIAGNHRNQAMRDALAEQLGYETEAKLLKEKDELQPAFEELLKQTPVSYIPAKNVSSMYDLEDLNDKIFLNNLTHGLPPNGENRSRYAIYLIARAERRGQKMTQQEAADIVHVSRVAVARQIMRDKGTVGIRSKSILPADYEAEPEAQEVMEVVEQESKEKQKAKDPLLDATLALFSNLRAVHKEMLSQKISQDELIDYMEDIVGKNLTGFKIDRYAFESIAQAVVILFKE